MLLWLMNIGFAGGTAADEDTTSMLPVQCALKV